MCPCKTIEEATKQAQYGWERAAEKDRAYGEALRERDEAVNREAAALAERIIWYDRGRSESRERCEQLESERDEALAEVERLSAQSDLLRRDADHEYGASATAIHDAYRRGNENMRNACAMFVHAHNAVRESVDADAIRALPIPEEK